MKIKIIASILWQKMRSYPFSPLLHQLQLFVLHFVSREMWETFGRSRTLLAQVLWAKDLKGQLKFLCLWFWVKYHCREVGIEGRDNRHPSNLKVKVKVAQLFLTLYDPMEFSRPEYWSGLLFPSPGDLPNPGIKPRSPALQVDSLPAESPGKSSSSGPWESELEEEQV